jgi:hypothetical protein
MISRNFETLVRAIYEATDLDFRLIENTIIETVEQIVDDELIPIRKEIEELRKELRASVLGEQ